MRLLKFFTVCLVFLSYSELKGQENFYKDFEIYNRSGEYTVRERISLEKTSFQSGDQALQFAINNMAEAGGNINVLSGEYWLDNTVILEDNITIDGSGTSTVFRISQKNKSGIGFLAESKDRVVLDNFSIKAGRSNHNAKSGIVLDHCGDCTVKDIYGVGLKEHGIWLRNNSFLSEIRGCHFADIGKSAIYLDELAGGGRGGDFVPNLISNNIIYRGGAGIELNHSLVINIVACEVYQSGGPGFYLHNRSNSVLISGSRTFQIKDDAVRVENSHELNINGNIFAWHEGNGIVLNDVTWGIISGNEIIDTGNIPFEYEPDDPRQYWKAKPDDLGPYQRTGIIVSEGSRGVTVGNNAIFNWASNPPMKYGILEDASSHDNSFVNNNNINFFAEEAVRSAGKNSIVKHNISEAGAHMGKSDRVHSFDPRVIDQFIDDQR